MVLSTIEINLFNYIWSHNSYPGNFKLVQIWSKDVGEFQHTDQPEVNKTVRYNFLDMSMGEKI